MTASRSDTCPIRATPGGRFAGKTGGATTYSATQRADRVDVPRPPGRRRDHALLPAHPRAPTTGSPPIRSRTRSGTRGKPLPRPSASNWGSPGRTTSARSAHSSSGSTRSTSHSGSSIPRLGEPVAVQRKVDLRIHPEAEWSSSPSSTSRPSSAPRPGRPRSWSTTRSRSTPLSQYKADSDFQPDVYLAGRWLEGDPAALFRVLSGLRVIRVGVWR